MYIFILLLFFLQNKVSTLIFIDILWLFLIKQLFHSRLLDMLQASLAIYHLISNARSWNNCEISVRYTRSLTNSFICKVESSFGHRSIGVKFNPHDITRSSNRVAYISMESPTGLGIVLLPISYFHIVVCFF